MYSDMITCARDSEPAPQTSRVGARERAILRPVESDGVLESGYGAAAPAGDNLCNDYAQGLADGFASLPRARGDRVDDDAIATLTDRGSGSLFGNVAVVRQPLDDNGWSVLAGRMHAFYGGRPGGSFVVFSAWPTIDLTGHDFGRVGHPPLMLRTAGPVAGEPVADLDIRQVTDAPAARDWEYVMVNGYPEPALQPFEVGCLLPERALTAPGWRHGSAISTVSPSRRRRQLSAITTSMSSSWRQ